MANPFYSPFVDPAVCTPEDAATCVCMHSIPEHSDPLQNYECTWDDPDISDSPFECPCRRFLSIENAREDVMRQYRAIDRRFQEIERERRIDWIEPY